MPTGEQVLARARQEFLNLPYLGTRVDSDPNAQGDALALQREVAAALDTLNFVPQHRRTHFAYLANHPVIRHRGWIGRIVSVTPVPGGVSVAVEFYPRLDHLNAGKPLITGDHTVETYRYDGQRLQHISSVVGKKTTPGLIMP